MFGVELLFKRKRGRPRKKHHLLITLLIHNIKITSHLMDIKVQIDHAPISGHLNVTPSGATIQSPSISSSNNDVVTIQDNGDGTFIATIVGVGTATINASALTQASNTLTAAATITVTPLEATGIEVVFDNV